MFKRNTFSIIPLNLQLAVTELNGFFRFPVTTKNATALGWRNRFSPQNKFVLFSDFASFCLSVWMILKTDSKVP